MLDKTRLRIATQKSGRLSEDCHELLSRCGIKINLQQQRLIAFAENMPIDILRVRDDDIPGLVMDGVVDLGIIGENVLEEELLNRRAQGENPRYLTLRRLDFGRCRLSLAAPLDATAACPRSVTAAPQFWINVSTCKSGANIAGTMIGLISSSVSASGKPSICWTLNTVKVFSMGIFSISPCSSSFSSVL